MSYTIENNNIVLTRGDTFCSKVDIYNCSGEPYIPTEDESVRFAMKRRYNDIAPLLVIDIPINSLILIIESYMTKGLPCGRYVYDIQITRANGYVDTFIANGRIDLTEEVL